MGLLTKVACFAPFVILLVLLTVCEFKKDARREFMRVLLMACIGAVTVGIAAVQIRDWVESRRVESRHIDSPCGQTGTAAEGNR